MAMEEEWKLVLSLPRETVENILGYTKCCSVCKVIGIEEKFSFNCMSCSLHRCHGCEELFCLNCRHKDLVKCCCSISCGLLFCIPRAEQWINNQIAWHMIREGIWDRNGNVLKTTLRDRGGNVLKATLSGTKVRTIDMCIRLKANVTFGCGSEVYPFIISSLKDFNNDVAATRQRELEESGRGWLTAHINRTLATDY